MGNRCRQCDVSHTLTTNGGLGHLNTAAVTDDALIADLLILAAVALPVLDRSENALTEESVLLRLQRSVVDGLRLLHFAVGPLQNLIRRSQADLDRIKLNRLIYIIKLCHLSSYYS